MEIKDFLWLMWRGARYLILGLLLGIGIGLAASILQPPTYEASTKVLVNRPRQQSNVDLMPLSEDQLVTTNALMVKTKPVLDETGSEMGGIKINPDSITVTVLPNTMVIQIKVQGQDPTQAAAIANTLVKILIKENEDILAQRYAATESALTAQIDQVQKQIDDLQTQYMQINDASIQEQIKLAGQQIELLKSSIASLEQDINSFPANLSVAQSAALAQKQAQLEQQRSLLNLYQQLQVNLTFTGQPGVVGSRPIPVLTNIQSDIDLYQQIYLSLQNSLEANRSERTLNTPDVLQIDPAVAPKAPIRPLPTLYLLLGALVGFSLAASAILLVDHLKNPLKNARQVEQLLGFPVLGLVSGLAKRAKGDLSSMEPSEAFRALGAAIEIARGEGKVGTLMVVNGAPGENEAAIAAHLAMAYARQGRQVVLVDGDMLHPSLHNLFSKENRRGLAELVQDPEAVVDAGEPIQGAENLTLVSAGHVSDGSASWLNAEKWRITLSKLRRPKGIVIVNSPSPETADAQTLASKVDGILLAIKAEETSAEAAQATVKRFKLTGAHVLGVVLQQAAPARRLPRSLLSSKKTMTQRKETPSAGTSKVDEAPTLPS